MKGWIHSVMQALTAVVILGLGVFAIDITYLGSIDDNLYAPTSLEVYPDGLAVLEPYSRQIKLFTPEGVITRQVHVPGNIHGLARLSQDTYLVCDRERGTVVSVDVIDRVQADWLGVADGLVAPADLVIYKGTLYVLDAGAGVIFSVDRQGQVTGQLALVDPNGLPIVYASSFDYDPASGRFYIMDQLQSRVCAITSDGRSAGSFGSFGSEDGQLTRGGEISVSPDGRVFVTDRFQGRILVFSSDGEFIGQTGDNPESQRTLAIPTGIDVDENGMLYVASTMGAGINIYYAPVATKPARTVAAWPQFPEDQAEVTSEHLTLVAFAEAEGVDELVVGFDFQLFAESSLQQPVEEAEGVATEAGDQPESAPSRVTATWTPQTELVERKSYFWRTRTRTADTLGDWSAMRSFSVYTLPNEFHLSQNYPNPFNPDTRFSFALPNKCAVVIEVFSLLGRRVKVLTEGEFEAGRHEISWDGTDQTGALVASGVYFYRLRANEFVQSRKMVLLK
jgi:hypothetical protein